jgi:hypothetical protein
VAGLCAWLREASAIHGALRLIFYLSQPCLQVRSYSRTIIEYHTVALPRTQPALCQRHSWACVSGWPLCMAPSQAPAIQRAPQLIIYLPQHLPPTAKPAGPLLFPYRSKVR